MFRFVKYLGRYFNVRNILKYIPYSKNRLHNKTYIIFTIRQFDFILNQELFIANILAKNGAKVVVVLDDGLFKHWDTAQNRNNNYKSELNPAIGSYIKTAFVRYFLTLSYRHPNIKVTTSKKLLKSPQYNYPISNFHRFALDSTKRYFMKGSFDINNAEEKYYYDLSIENSRISLNLAHKIFDVYSPISGVIMSHGIYSTWGPIYSHYKLQSIPTYVYGANVYTKSHVYITDTLTQTLNEDTKLRSFESTKPIMLNEAVRNMVLERLNERIELKSKDNKYYYRKENLHEIKIDKEDDDVIFGMFPNVVWDGDISERSRLFKSIQDWVIETIKIFLDAPRNHKLLIKLHPGETTLWKDSYRLYEIILSHFPNIQSEEKIIIVDSNMNIDTYKLIQDNIDYGIIYDGIMALEMFYLGIPVITVSNGRYTNKKFFIEPKSISEYSLIIKTQEYLKKRAIESFLYKDDFFLFCYWFFYKSSYYLPVFCQEKFGQITIPKNLTDAECAELSRSVECLCSL